MNKSTKTTVQEIVDFSALAQKYCDMIEEYENRPTDEFLKECAYLLANLFAATLTFRDLDASSPPTYEGSTSYDRNTELSTHIADKLGSYNRYWEVANPYEFADPVSMTLGEDLADIYCNLKDGLVIFHGGDSASVKQAAVHWKMLFFHWGEHIVDALRAIQRTPYINI